MAGKNSGNDIRCSFCNKTQSQVRKLIAGPAGVYICDECVEMCIRDSLMVTDDSGRERKRACRAADFCYVRKLYCP